MEQDHNDFSNNFRLETGIGPTVDRILNSLLERITSDNFKEKLAHRVIDPVTEIVSEKVKPYMYAVVILYAIVILLLLIIIYLLRTISIKRIHF